MRVRNRLSMEVIGVSQKRRARREGHTNDKKYSARESNTKLSVLRSAPRLSGNRTPVCHWLPVLSDFRHAPSQTLRELSTPHRHATRESTAVGTEFRNVSSSPYTEDPTLFPTHVAQFGLSRARLVTDLPGTPPVKHERSRFRDVTSQRRVLGELPDSRVHQHCCRSRERRSNDAQINTTGQHPLTD